MFISTTQSKVGEHGGGDGADAGARAASRGGLRPRPADHAVASALRTLTRPRSARTGPVVFDRRRLPVRSERFGGRAAARPRLHLRAWRIPRAGRLWSLYSASRDEKVTAFFLSNRKVLKLGRSTMKTTPGRPSRARSLSHAKSFSQRIRRRCQRITS